MLLIKKRKPFLSLVYHKLGVPPHQHQMITSTYLYCYTYCLSISSSFSTDSIDNYTSYIFYFIIHLFIIVSLQSNPIPTLALVRDK
jgi:hypothetical protein